MPIVTALCGLVIGFIVGMAVEQRRHRVTFNEPDGELVIVPDSFLSSPKGITQFFEATTPQEKYKTAKEITDVLTHE